MSIQVECGRCGKQSSAPDDWAGKRAKCPKCGAKVEIPTPLVEVDLVEPMADLLKEELGTGPAVADPMSDPFAAMSAPAASSLAGGVTLRHRKAPRRAGGDGFAAWLRARKLSLAVAPASCLVFLILAFFGAVTAGLVVGGIGILVAAMGLSSRLAEAGTESRPKPVNMSRFWRQVGGFLAVSVPYGFWSTRNFQRPEIRGAFILFCVFFPVIVVGLGTFGGVVLRRFGLFRIAAWTYLGLFAAFVCVAFSGAFGTLAGDRASASAEADVEDERDTKDSTIADMESAGVDWDPWPDEPEPEPKPPPQPAKTAGAVDREESSAASATPEPYPGSRMRVRPGFPEGMRGPGMRTSPWRSGTSGAHAPSGMPGRRGPFGPDAARKQLVDRFGADKVVAITVHNVSSESFAQVHQSVRAAAGVPGMVANHTNSQATITIAPVDDVEALAAKLDIGKVTNVDPRQRTITVEAQAGQ